MTIEMAPREHDRHCMTKKKRKEKKKAEFVGCGVR